ncbi:hypothetical protein [Synechococcus sp. PCC 7336]|uniref:hypothetical protein n=1 Tax=Synechococcus sp. PCC 7336 TaxID=195250 RepID=UPI00034BF03C|nr:hypothetical protein [Synechococcus sp. PCC 7336]
MSNGVKAAPSAREIQEVIAELEQYRARIYEDTLAVAKKAKLPKKMVMQQLENHPDVVKIDAAVTQLKTQLSASDR